MDNTVGYVLLGSAAVPALIGWSLARSGFQKTETAADAAKAAAQAATQQIAASQQVTAAASGADATTVAQANSQVAQQVGAVQDALGGVNEALKGLTGVFAPASGRLRPRYPAGLRGAFRTRGDIRFGRIEHGRIDDGDDAFDAFDALKENPAIIPFATENSPRVGEERT